MGLYHWIADAVVGLLLACAAFAAGLNETGPARLELRPCHADGIADEVRCAVLDVYEDRDRQAGRRIPIHVTVVPALVRDAEPDPLVVLAGGPGQGARSYAPLVPRFFQRVRRTRDIVLVDLRGTGDSAPLACPLPEGVAIFLASAEPPEESTRRCLAALGADPRLYTHQNSLADLREVLDRLGYQRVNLWGGSWGTRSALVFASRYPDLVRTVTLDGAVAAAMDFPHSYPFDAARALDLMLAACEAEAVCRRAFPNARALIVGWLAGLEQQPFEGVVRHPRSGDPMHLRLDRSSATEILRAALYSPIDTSRLLIAVRRAASGDPSIVLAMAERAAGWSLDTMALGQTHAILCSEDVGRHPAPAREPDSIFGTSAVDGWIERCAGWPRGAALDIDDHTVLATPALILSGELDPVTPPARGDAMRRHFPNSLHVVVPGGGHNVSFSGCLPRLIAAFIERADLQSFDPSCASDVVRPPFVTTSAGEQP